MGVININNNINANNNNNNQVNLNFGNNNNLVTNLNQNVGNNFNLMFPPGRRKRRSIPSMEEEVWQKGWREMVTHASCKADMIDDNSYILIIALQALRDV